LWWHVRFHHLKGDSQTAIEYCDELVQRFPNGRWAEMATLWKGYLEEDLRERARQEAKQNAGGD
jgi:hypothetical protein